MARCSGLAAGQTHGAGYQCVELAIWECLSGGDKGLCAESDGVARPGSLCGDRLTDGVGDHGGWGVTVGIRLGSQGFRHCRRLLFVRTGTDGGVKVVGGDVAPFGGDGTGLDDYYIDTKRRDLDSQAVAERLKGELRAVIPAAERGVDLSSHGRDVHDRPRALCAHVG